MAIEILDMKSKIKHRRILLKKRLFCRIIFVKSRSTFLKIDKRIAGEVTHRLREGAYQFRYFLLYHRVFCR